MLCYKCNAALSETDFCNSCGADVALYKRIVKTSNLYYNIGLEKAKVRDLTGAIDYLSRSINLYKKNINVRNLLGLVNYEMGNFVEALSEWVISKNFQADKNIADDYINAIQNNQTRLEAINQTIKKYNMALSYAKQGSYDLAVIQLRKVLSLNPNLIKGHQLLALLYIKDNEIEKARQAIQKSLRIDKTNTLSIRYLNEINEMIPATDDKVIRKSEMGRLGAHDVIIPTGGYKDFNNGKVTIINIIIGILIGAAVVFFIVTPARTKALRSENNAVIREYEDKFASLESQNKDLQAQIDTLSGEKNELEEKLSAGGGIQGRYDNLIQAYIAYSNRNYVEGAQMLSAITSTEEMSENFMNIYNQIQGPLYKEAGRLLYNSGTRAMNSRNYPTAITELTKSFEYDPANANALYNLARSYQQSGDIENANLHFNKVIELFPGTSQAVNSQNNINQ